MEPRGADDESTRDESITQRTTQRLVEGLPPDIDIARVEATVRDQVRELRATARFDNFIGIIAERKARRRLLEDGPATR